MRGQIKQLVVASSTSPFVQPKGQAMKGVGLGHFIKDSLEYAGESEPPSEPKWICLAHLQFAEGAGYGNVS